MRFVETINAQGHQNVLGTHKTTFEVTRDRELSKRGNCVIGVNANKAPIDFGHEFREACRKEGSKITVRLQAEGLTETIRGRGSPSLSFTHSREMVGRKSLYASDRTIMVSSDKAAYDLDKQLIAVLKYSKTKLNVQIIVEI